eukprot:UN04897
MPVFGCHLDSDQHPVEWYKTAERQLDSIVGGHGIILGDFNIPFDRLKQYYDKNTTGYQTAIELNNNIITCAYGRGVSC